jgi:hypothetical protein
LQPWLGVVGDEAQDDAVLDRVIAQIQALEHGSWYVGSTSRVAGLPSLPCAGAVGLLETGLAQTPQQVVLGTLWRLCGGAGVELAAARVAAAEGTRQAGSP